MNRRLRNRPLASGCAALIALALAGSLAAADYVALIDKATTTVWMKNGEQAECTDFKISGDGSITIVRVGEKDAVTLPRAKYDRYEEKRSWAESVTKRGGQALAANDFLEIERVLGKALERGEPEKAAALELARKGLEKWPDNTRVAKVVVDLLLAKGETDTAKGVLKDTLAKDRLWADGYRMLVKILQDAGDKAAIRALVKKLLDDNPTDEIALRLSGPIFEADGNVSGAADCYRKSFQLHKDQTAGVAWARMLLRRGQHELAAQTAGQVQVEGAQADEAAGIRGSALLALAEGDLGKVGEARKFLEASLKGSPSPHVKEWALYNLGLAAWLQGKPAEAQAAWSACHEPAAQLGLAMARKEPYKGGQLPEPLKTAVIEHNAGVELQRGDPKVSSLSKAKPRQAFLLSLSELLNNPVDAAVVDAVGASNPEAMRWQAYGHLLGRRYAQAETILAKLPPTDGFAIAYRIAAALGRGDTAAAAGLAGQLDKARNPPPPAAYAARVGLKLRPVRDDTIIAEFDADGEDPAQNGWQWEAPGGMTAAIARGRLVISGQQAGAADPVSRLVKLIQADRLQSIQAELDLASIGGAAAGLEVTDESKTVGAAVAVQSDNKLNWRELKGGAWGPWTALPVTLQGVQAVLRIDYNAGRLTAVVNNSTFPLGDGLPRTAQAVSAGVFGTANPGTQWKLEVERIRIDYRPAGKPR